MAKKKKRRAEKTVEDILFGRESYRHAVAKSNIEEALKHTLKVLRKARRRIV